MRRFRTISVFGGSEIILLKHPQIIKSINLYDAGLQNNSLHISFDDFLNSELLVDGYKIFSDSSLVSTADNIIPDMKNISAFIKENVAIYYPKTEDDNFWFDLLSLDYFYSRGLFIYCIVLLSNVFLKKISISFDKLLTILHSQEFNTPKSPMHVIWEQINKEPLSCLSP